jgi:tetratricopeptide (TPR) repeat protein
LDAPTNDMLTFESSPDRFLYHSQLIVVPESRLAYFFKTILQTSLALLICATFSAQLMAQDEFGDNAADPVKLFEQAQGAHARGEFEKALDLYEQAIKVRPEFPEAEFQRGNALVSLARFAEAEAAFKRASALKKNWSLPYSALGALLMRRDRDAEATQTFRQALAIDPKDNVALRLLSEIRLHAGDPKEALELAKLATQSPDAPTSSWIGLAIAERADGNKEGAKTILNRVINDEPNNLAALLERADLLTDQKDYDGAIADLQVAAKVRPNDKIVMARLAYVYQQAGRQTEANAVAKTAGLEIQPTNNGDKNQVIGTPEEIEAANNSDKAIARPALEKLIEKNPKSAMLLARLGATFRTEDPNRALELYRRAAELAPTVAEYAVGYAAALVQSRRFQEATYLLQQVVKREPQNYQAHANLATALYEAKQYPAAIAEFEWVVANKPEVIVAQYFIATSHDFLGEYPEALAAYEKFLSGADAKINQLEIEKVKLRLPLLQRQIKLGEGVKKKP